MRSAFQEELFGSEQYTRLCSICRGAPTKVQRLSSLNEPLDVEVKRLRRELKIAKQERDILKKATAYFAKETL